MYNSKYDIFKTSDGRTIIDNVPYIYESTINKWISDQFFIVDYNIISNIVRGNRYLYYQNIPSSEYGYKFLNNSWIKRIYFSNDINNINADFKLIIDNNEIFNFTLNNEQNKSLEVNIYIDGILLNKNLECLLQTNDILKNVNFKLEYHLYKESV